MRHQFRIEDIETLRRLAGIDDAELRERVRRLAAGDRVNITLLGGSGHAAGETLVVRITDISEGVYRGKLVARPASRWLSGVHAGASVTFRAAHVHSLPKVRPAYR